ncbi:NAD(P)H-binding protein [Gracilaria domingensis]|nr:NAD(P)H-binding protein [Gracilaria domingensis]
MIIQAASAHQSTPQVHAFVRNPDSLSDSVRSQCASVQKGDALQVDDVHNALVASNTSHLIVAIGIPNDLSPTSLRTDSAKSITEAIDKCGRDVKVVVVSSLGAGGTKIQIGFGFGMIAGAMLRNVLKDHDGQEECFNKSFENKKNSLLIVRPVNLTEGQGGANTQLFDGHKRTPSSKLDREDLAKWIVQQICENGDKFGQSVNIARA